MKMIRNYEPWGGIGEMLRTAFFCFFFVKIRDIEGLHFYVLVHA